MAFTSVVGIFTDVVDGYANQRRRAGSDGGALGERRSADRARRRRADHVGPRLVACDGEDDALAADREGRDRISRRGPALSLFRGRRARFLRRQGVPPLFRSIVRRPSIPAGRPPRRGGCARRGGYRGHRGDPEGAEVVTGWLLETLLPAPAPIVAALP